MEEQEIRKVAQKLKIKNKPDAPIEHLEAQIAQQPMSVVAAATKEVQNYVAPVLYVNTEQEVREAISQYISKDGFIAAFYPDNTWHFKFRRKVDTGHMSMQLYKIKEKAQLVAQGGRPLMGMNEHFDKGEAKGYADNVLGTS